MRNSAQVRAMRSQGLCIKESQEFGLIDMPLPVLSGLPEMRGMSGPAWAGSDSSKGGIPALAFRGHGFSLHGSAVIDPPGSGREH